MNIHHNLFKMAVGVVVALALHLATRKNGGVAGLKDELKLLVVPVMAIGAGYLFMGSGYEEAGEATLIALATALGLNSSKAK